MSVQLKIKKFDTPEEAAAYQEGFKDFCESLSAQLKDKGAASFFGTKEIKKVGFQNAIVAHHKQLPEPPQSETGFWQAIQSHTHRVMGKNGHSKTGNLLLDLFRTKENK